MSLLPPLAVVLIAAGCSKCSPQDHDPRPAASVERTATSCVGSADPQRRHVLLTVGSIERSVFVVPPTTSKSPAPVVIGFHGRGGNGEAVARDWSLHGEPNGLLGLYPDGLPQPWLHNLVGWDTRSESSQDLELVKALLRWAKANYCVDAGRIHVIGWSWGAAMANLAACRDASFRSVVSVAGGGPTVPCAGPVAAMVVHGRADKEEPIASGDAALDTWAFYNGCTSRQDEADGRSRVGEPALGDACTSLPDCSPSHPTLWCEHAGGHGWPKFLRDGGLLRWLEW